ncbi:MAG: CopD family protein [Alphaproteobacteria bacterium]
MTSVLYAALIALHLLAAILWVGGMFFAHMVLRPSVAEMPPKERLALWGQVLPRFFTWVWRAVVVLPLTGYFAALWKHGDLKYAESYVHVMTGIGLVMILLFVFLYFVPYNRFRTALNREDLPAAASHQGTIRRIVSVNLVLGLVVSALSVFGR